MTLVTFLCPTRGKPDDLQASIEALVKHAADPDCFDVLLYLDDDDPAIYPHIERVTAVRGPRKGYARLHECIAEHLVPRAHGTWLWIWNDDAMMQTPGWDTILQEIPSEAVLNPDSNRSHETGINTFPVVPREWVDLVGWAQNGANDTWWQVVGQMMNRHLDAPIKVHHIPTDSRTQGYDPATFFNLETYARMGFAAGRIHQALYADR